jgi:CHAT domain-containing protein
MKNIFPFKLFITFGILFFFSFQVPKTSFQVDELLSKANSFAEAEQFDSAAIYYEKARKLAQQKNINTSLQSVLGKELALWTTRSDIEYSERIKQFNLLWKEFKEDPYFLQEYYFSHSSLFLFEMNVDSFEYYYSKTMKQVEILKDWNYEVMYHTFIAQNFFYADEYLLAIKYLNKAHQSLTKTKEPQHFDLLSYYFVCNEIYQEIGDHEFALKSSLICLEIIKKSKPFNSSDYKIALNNIAVNYNELEDFEKGLKFYEEAKSLITESYENESSVIYENLGKCLNDLNRNNEAYVEFKKAIDFSLSAEKPVLKDQISAYESMAYFFVKTNRPDSALRCADKLIDLLEKSKTKKEKTLEVLGKIYSAAEDFEKARYYFEKAEDFFFDKYGKKNYKISHFFYSYANHFTREKNYIKAIEYIQKAIIANTNAEFVSTDFRNNPEMKSINDLDLMVNELRLKSIILDSMRVNNLNDVKAIDIFNTTNVGINAFIEITRSVNYQSKLFWLNDRAHTLFQHAIYYALLTAEEEKDEKYKHEAFLMSELSRSILLYESLQEKTASRFAGVPDSLIEKENELRKYAIFIEKQKRDADNEKNKAKIAEYDSELFEIQQEIEKITALLRQNYPSYYQLKYPELKIKPKDIMSKLGDSTVMIEYFQGKYRSFVFVIRNNSFDCHQIIADSTVNNRVLEFQKLVSDLPYAMKQPEEYFEKYKKSAFELYNFWLGPYLSPKDKGKRLVIINDGSLSYLPFEALLTADVKTKNPNYKSLPYLLKDYTINYDYSAELWLRHQQFKKQLNGRVYAMAPSYIKKAENSESSVSPYRTGKEKNLRSGIGELPGAEKEFKMLKNRYKGFYPSKMNASEKTWKENAHEYGILHFAMHGLIDEKEPEFSSLVFTEDGNKEEDNFLYAYEIKQSKLNASMVVLSACETGAGKYQRGEGVLSLGRGFMYAGVPSLVMTLWKLNDQSASELIGNFYANLEVGQQKDKALQDAKIKYLETSNDMAAHPALWACFIQLGDYSPIILAQKSYFNYLIISAVIGSVIVLLLFFYRRKNKKATA